MSQSLVSFTDDSEYTDTVFRSEYIIILSGEWNFQTSFVTLTWICSLSAQNQYSLLKKLNMILNCWQLNILDVQSDIVSYVMQKKLWRTYIDETMFQAAWKDTVKKTLKHWTQQNKIQTAIEIIRQYWGDDVWNRYFQHRWYTYAEIEEIRKLIRKCRDWDTACQLILTVVHQRLETRICSQQSSTQIQFSDWTWATLKHKNYVNQSLCFISDSALRAYSDLVTTAQFLLSLTWFSSHSTTTSTTSQHCAESKRSVLQSIESSNLSLQLSVFSNIRTQHNSTESLHAETVWVWNWEDFILQQFAEEQLHTWSCEASSAHTQTEISTLISSHTQLKLTDSDPWVSELSELMTQACLQCSDISAQLIENINKVNKAIKAVVEVIDQVKNEEMTERRVCFLHQKKLADTADFQVRMLNSQTMNDWLCVYWNNHFHISKLKMNTATWQWFQAADHSSWSVNNLEIYNFTHHELPFQIHIISIHNWLKIVDEDWK